MELQIAELLLVFKERLQLDHARAERGIVFVERFGELDVASGEDRRFQRGNAAQSPGSVGDGLDQIGFALTDRLEFVLIGADVALIFGGIVASQENSAAG